ncbi:hypothetical protein VULLAG_LOCUS1403 [Vulpes lagopus]
MRARVAPPAAGPRATAPSAILRSACGSGPGPAPRRPPRPRPRPPASPSAPPPRRPPRPRPPRRPPRPRPPGVPIGPRPPGVPLGPRTPASPSAPPPDVPSATPPIVPLGPDPAPRRPPSAPPPGVPLGLGPAPGVPLGPAPSRELGARSWRDRLPGRPCGGRGGVQLRGPRRREVEPRSGSRRLAVMAVPARGVSLVGGRLSRAPALGGGPRAAPGGVPRPSEQRREDQQREEIPSSRGRHCLPPHLSPSSVIFLNM